MDIYVKRSIPEALSEDDVALGFNISYKLRVIPVYPFIIMKTKDETNNTKQRLTIKPNEGLLCKIVITETTQPIIIKPNRQNENSVSRIFI